ncbi:hypothetical protein [uncultured Psychroserpens sp.]|uniref:hypothetical protein n=1 Tax=uncultured Psychroserpens sp. TaxID=255436 RepID=UPI00261A5D21|nr:hypothetical protein [uncultured Psychroserpens sp.]
MYFDVQIAKHLKTYKNKSDLAMQKGDRDYAKSLFDSLFNNHLKNSHIRDIALKKIKGGTYKTSLIDKPFLLVTKSPWELINEEEIEEINRLSKMYKNQIDIIILFWDSRLSAKALSKDYDSNVIVTYVDERENQSNHIIKLFKHSFGAPACFFISESKQLMKIDRKFILSSNGSVDISLNSTHHQIKLMLFDGEKTNKGIITTVN